MHVLQSGYPIHFSHEHMKNYSMESIHLTERKLYYAGSSF